MKASDTGSDSLALRTGVVCLGSGISHRRVRIPLSSVLLYYRWGMCLLFRDLTQVGVRVPFSICAPQLQVGLEWFFVNKQPGASWFQKIEDLGLGNYPFPPLLTPEQVRRSNIQTGGQRVTAA